MGSNPFLGKLAWKFHNPYGRIYEDPSSRTVDLYPAGYSQIFQRKLIDTPNACDMVPRQEVYKQLYDFAVEIGKDCEYFPFREFEYSVKIEREMFNRFDKNAIGIYIDAPSTSPLSFVYDFHAGYIPADIAPELLRNLNRISDIAILGVSNDVNDKYYCARIVFAYDGKKFKEIT